MTPANQKLGKAEKAEPRCKGRLTQPPQPWFGLTLSRLRGSAGLLVFITRLAPLIMNTPPTVFNLKSRGQTGRGQTRRSNPGKQAGGLKTDRTGGSRMMSPVTAGPERSKAKAGLKGAQHGGHQRRCLERANIIN